MTADSSDEEDEDSLPTFSSPSSPSSSLAPPDSALAPTHTPLTEQGPHHSGRQHVLTEKGAAWAAKLAATCTHLDTLAECRITVCYAGCIVKDLSSSAHSGVVQGHVEVQQALGWWCEDERLVRPKSSEKSREVFLEGNLATRSWLGLSHSGSPREETRLLCR